MRNVVNNIIIDLDQVTERGTPWQVRVYKKVFGFKRPISDDWFLDEGQARAYAEELRKDLKSSASITALKERKPGWTLHK